MRDPNSRDLGSQGQNQKKIAQDEGGWSDAEGADSGGDAGSFGSPLPPGTFEQLIAPWERFGFNFLYQEFPDRIEIAHIELGDENGRGEGAGTRFLNDHLKPFLDRSGKGVVFSNVVNPGFFVRIPWLIRQKNGDFSYMPRSASVRTAGKLHDFLMSPKSRPDLQTPEGQRLLKYLEHIHDDRLDDIMPWVAREWKKGRIHQSEDGERGHLYWKMDPSQRGTNLWQGDEGEQDPTDLLIGEPVQGWMKQNLLPDRLREIADWYHDRRHPMRRGKDIMQMQLPDVLRTTDEYHNDLSEKAMDQAVKGGEVVHQYPDDWTLRRLTTPEECDQEGEAMGNCVGGYGNQVQNGSTMIYSLRDPDHKPHVTMEIAPGHHEEKPFDIDQAIGEHPSLRGLPLELREPLKDYNNWIEKEQQGEAPRYPDTDLHELWRTLRANWAQRHSYPVPNRGQLVQIEGRGAYGNEPKDEYKQRIKQWFQTFPPEERPTRDEDGWYDRDGVWHTSLDDPNMLEEYVGEHGFGREGEDEYGLPHQPLEADYNELVGNIGINDYGPWATHNSGHVDDIYELAKARGEIPQLAKAAEGYSDNQQINFDDWLDQNYEISPRYPDAPHGYEDEEGEEVNEDHPDAKPYWKANPGNDERQYSEEEAEKEYDDTMTSWQDQHPGIQATHQLYSLLSPHYWYKGEHPQGTGYQNEIKPQEGTFSKTAFFDTPGFHYNGYTGRRCTCPWNSQTRWHDQKKQQERYGFYREAGQQLNRLLKDPGKKLKTPEGTKFLEALKEVTTDHPDTDGLVPWFVQRFKQGELGATGVPGERHWLGEVTDPEARPNQINGMRLDNWGEWFNARQHPLRRGVNVLDKSFDLRAMNDISRRHQGDLAEKRRIAELAEEGEYRGQPVFGDLPDGYHIRELGPEDLEYESDALGHCIGTDPMYGEALGNGEIRAFSLRDKNAIPKATYHLNPSGTLAHWQGESGEPKDEYRDMIGQHLNSIGVEPYEHGEEPLNQWWDDEYDMEGPDDYNELKHWVEDGPYEYQPEEYRMAEGEAEERGQEAPQLNVGNANWRGVLDSINHVPERSHYDHVKRQYVRTPARDLAYDPKRLEDVQNYLQLYGQAGDAGALEEALKDARDESGWKPFEPSQEMLEHPDPFERQRHIQEAEELHSRDFAQDPHIQMLNHIGPEYVQDWEPIGQPNTFHTIHPDQEDLFREQSPVYHFDPEDNSPPYIPYKYPQYENLADADQSGLRNYPMTFSKIASNSAPTYYRWVFSPASGEVTLGHNWESHPADTNYHGEMAGNLNEPDLVHGYAYRIGGGWRLSDWESKPLTDPFISAQVIRALRSREGTGKPPAASEGAWQPQDTDFESFQYGLPR